MMVDAVNGIVPDDEVAPLAQATPPQVREAAVPFANLVVQGLEQVNERLRVSQSDLQGLALGEPVELHDVMRRLEESRIALQLVLQVRNRVLEAYQDLMRMQL